MVLAASTAILTFVLMMLGGYVKAIGAGVACPDWPTCWGEWFPPFEEAEGFSGHKIMAEWTHRLVAAVTGFVFLATGFLAWRRRVESRAFAVLPWAALATLLVQVLLGGLTVTRRLEPSIVVAHLGTATLFFGMVLVLATTAWRRWREGAAAAKGAAARTTPDGPASEAAAMANDASLGSSRSAPVPVPGEAHAAPHERVSASGPRPGDGTPWGQAKLLLALMKPRIVFLLAIMGLTAMFLAGGRGVPAGLIGWTMLGGFLAAGSAMAFNMYLERDVDARMARTAKRPIPSGRLAPGKALVFGWATGVASFGVLAFAVNVLTALLAAAGLLYYVFVYTLWLKPSTPQNIVIGGAAGGFPALVGWAAVANEVSWAAFLLGSLVFLWTPPHFWALALVYKEDYRRAPFPMYPLVKGEARTKLEMLLYTVVLFVASTAFTFAGLLSPVYLLAATILGGVFILLNCAVLNDTGTRSARTMFHYSILYLGLLFLAIIGDALIFATSATP